MSSGHDRVGICSCISSLNSTASRLIRTSPAPLKPMQTFFAVNTWLKAALKTGRKVSLLIWWMRLHAKAKILLPHIYFNSKKQTISSGYNRSNECTGMQRVIIFFSLQQSWKQSEEWLLWPSTISSLYTLIGFTYILKCSS